MEIQKSNDLLLQLRKEAQKRAYGELREEFLELEDFESLQKLKKLNGDNQDEARRSNQIQKQEC